MSAIHLGNKRSKRIARSLSSTREECKAEFQDGTNIPFVYNQHCRSAHSWFVWSQPLSRPGARFPFNAIDSMWEHQGKKDLTSPQGISMSWVVEWSDLGV